MEQREAGAAESPGRRSLQRSILVLVELLSPSLHQMFSVLAAPAISPHYSEDFEDEEGLKEPLGQVGRPTLCSASEMSEKQLLSNISF